MDDKSTFVDIINEIIAEDIVVLEELIKEEIEPIIKQQKELENKIASKAIAEMYRLEQEATGQIEKEKAYTWLKR